MTGGEHCILVHLEQPVDQKSGFDAPSLEAYKQSLHEYVWQSLDPLMADAQFGVVHERWVFEVDDPAGGSHATDVVFGGLDPGLFGRLFERWRRRPLKAARAHAAEVPGDEPGYGKEDIDAVWADMSNIDRAFSPESLEGRRTWHEVENDLDVPDWEHHARLSKKLASGFYAFDSGFFSLAHGSSKLTPQQLAEVRADPASFALVFVPAKN